MVAGLDGHGELDIFLQSFDHGTDAFKIPGWAANCVLWSTSRRGPLRTGYDHGGT